VRSLAFLESALNHPRSQAGLNGRAGRRAASAALARHRIASRMETAGNELEILARHAYLAFCG